MRNINSLPKLILNFSEARIIIINIMELNIMFDGTPDVQMMEVINKMFKVITKMIRYWTPLDMFQ